MSKVINWRANDGDLERIEAVREKLQLPSIASVLRLAVDKLHSQECECIYKLDERSGTVYTAKCAESGDFSEVEKNINDSSQVTVCTGVHTAMYQELLTKSCGTEDASRARPRPRIEGFRIIVGYRVRVHDLQTTYKHRSVVGDCLVEGQTVPEWNTPESSQEGHSGLEDGAAATLARVTPVEELGDPEEEALMALMSTPTIASDKKAFVEVMVEVWNEVAEGHAWMRKASTMFFPLALMRKCAHAVGEDIEVWRQMVERVSRLPAHAARKLHFTELAQAVRLSESQLGQPKIVALMSGAYASHEVAADEPRRKVALEDVEL